MSGQNTPISTTLSLLSLNTPRVSVEATFNSDQPGIKTLLGEFFTGAKLFAKIQRKDNRITTATIQGHPKQFPASLDYLKELLQIKYNAAIVWGEMIAVAEENRYNSIIIEETFKVGKVSSIIIELYLFSSAIIIEETLPTLKRDSGECLERELEEISFGGSAATENVKKIVKEAVASVTNAATGFGIATGWIPAVKEKHISVKSSIQSLEMLIQAVSKKIQIPQPIKLLYTIEDNDPIVVTDVKDLREGFLYYALTVNEELPRKQTAKFSPEMEHFFERLKTVEDMSDAQVEIAKESFSSQGITYKQLMKTGDLAITDAELKDYGITQGGLRKAILAVIKSNIQ
jgi:uncharacterized protein YsxB (DUF464 family)